MQNTSSKTRDIAYAGLFIALITVSAWVTIPLGPIPGTLQMLSISLAIFTLRPRVAISAVYGYVLLGAVGVPVFSGMRGGLAALVGPTGGFLCGYLVAVPVACALLWLARRAGLVRVASARNPLACAEGTLQKGGRILAATGAYMVAGMVFTAISYAFGTAWFMVMSNTPLEAALAACVVPFIVPDVLKIALAAAFANALAPVMQQYVVPYRGKA